MILSKALCILVATFIPLGCVSEVVTIDTTSDNNDSSRLLRATSSRSLSAGLPYPMEMPCMLRKADKESSLHLDDDNICFCELQGSDLEGVLSFKIVQLMDIPPHWCDSVFQPGRTELLPGKLIVDDEEMHCTMETPAGENCWDQIVKNGQIHYQAAVTGNIKQLTSSSSRRSLMTGDRTVLVIQGIAGDTTIGTDIPTKEELSDSIFGTSGDPFNLKSQYTACSYGQLNFAPTTSFGENGVYSYISDTNAIGSTSSHMRNEVYYGARDSLGINLPTVVDHVMVCIPKGTVGDWIAYALVDHWLSWFNNEWCTFASVQLHEMGHNLGLAHSGHGLVEYGDQSGMMGYSYSGDDFPIQCFNGPKSYDLGWFSSYTVDFNSGTFNTWHGDIVGFVDRDNAGSRKMIIRMIDDVTQNSYYIHFNRQAGFNSGTQEGGDLVLVASKGPGYVPSYLEAELGGGEQYSISDFGGHPLIIKVDSIDDTLGDAVMKASISIKNPTLAGPNPTSVPTPGPTPFPTPLPTPLPTPGPTADPAPGQTQGPTDAPTPGPTQGPTVELITNDPRMINTPLNIEVAELSITRTNLALYKKATSSSDAPGYEAKRGVDGNNETIFHTFNNGNNWWEVDLETITVIQQIKLYNRVVFKERIHGAVVKILDINRDIVASGTVDAEAPDTVEFNFENAAGRYIRIDLFEGLLHLGEVEVYGFLSAVGMPNLAMNKLAGQSNHDIEKTANNGIDGNLLSITNVYGQNENVWFVNIEAVAVIRQIRIFNRQDCCKDYLQGAKIRILDHNFGTVNDVTIDTVADVYEWNVIDTRGQFVMISQSNGNALTMAEIEVFGTLSLVGVPDLALGRLALQSNTEGGENVAGNAINGNIESGTHTSGENIENWWMVDLEAIATIRQIKIYTSPDNVIAQESLHGAVISILDLNGNVLTEKTVLQTRPEVVEFNYPDTKGRFVRIDQPNGMIDIGEVEVHGKWLHHGMQNLALNKPAFINNPHEYYVASFAVDGDGETSVLSKYTNTLNYWWVDLGQVSTIKHIKIRAGAWNTRLRLFGAVIQVLDENMNKQNEIPIKEITYEGVEFSFVNTVGRYVRVIQLHDYLHFAEVEVYGIPIYN